ncbi:amidohydrolase [Emticicia sp. 21SJ11W-3]|uniref:amidohydrolase n=1 Tax=Emticicia sp. 21SJ11W-3 TaxID=2916755 RepID=UPI0020A1E49D|nr:amidohydrolase [Emticicia sp. 21SJ11W-3]UTA66157.1 amidohydrolase [Emticicia sp. 21SJ11W-3]
MRNLLITLLTATCSVAVGQSSLKPKISAGADAIEKKVVSWRRDFHENPELGNLEYRTSKIVADHLRSLGIDVQEKVGVTGVVGILKGGKPGPVVALRADMDGLPVTERVDVPFKSKVMTEYNGQKTGVMHACGHDSHVAILMGVAEILSSIKSELAGTVKFIFQPAEEGVYDPKLLKNGKSGAELMVMEGVMENPKVDAIFGLHISSVTEAGKIGYRPGATMAAVDQLGIKIKGKQTHGANPWLGIDPIVTASQIVLGLQTIVSRNVNITENPAIVTVGAIHGGIRQNIIPESLEMIGTIRTFAPDQRQLVHKRINEIATHIATSAGAVAEVKIDTGYPVTYNDPALTEKMIGTLEGIAGKENVIVQAVQTGAEDFSFFQQKVPGLFFFLGGMPKGQTNPAPHHTPDFYIDESGFTLGIKSLAGLTVDYFEMNAPKTVEAKPGKGRKKSK